jgi:hypothetical protein
MPNFGGRMPGKGQKRRVLAPRYGTTCPKCHIHLEKYGNHFLNCKGLRRNKLRSRIYLKIQAKGIVVRFATSNSRGLNGFGGVLKAYCMQVPTICTNYREFVQGTKNSEQALQAYFGELN